MKMRDEDAGKGRARPGLWKRQYNAVWLVLAGVVAIAIILLSDYLEPAKRSPVSRVRSDFRSLATALESYMIDHGPVPPPRLSMLSTPTAYIASVDFFDDGPYAANYLIRDGEWYLIAAGPDGEFQIDEATTTSLYPFLLYDPTNGVDSWGDIVRYGGGPMAGDSEVPYQREREARE